jgi:hypothetical protein
MYKSAEKFRMPEQMDKGERKAVIAPAKSTSSQIRNSAIVDRTLYGSQNIFVFIDAAKRKVT